MALPPDKNIPGADKLGQTASELADKAGAAAKKAVDAGNSAKASATDAAKSALSGSATPTAPAGNRGAGGIPPIPKQSTPNVDLPPPLPKSKISAENGGASSAAASAAGAGTGTGTGTAKQTASTEGRRTSITRPAGARPLTKPAPRPAPRATSGRPISDRPPQRRPAPRGRPVSSNARPPRRRPMAPPPGARNGRYAAPAGHRRKKGAYVAAPAAAATGGHAWGPLLFGILLLGAVAWYAIKYYTPMIKADLTTRTNSALADAGLGDTTSVEIDGRRAILSGNVSSQPDFSRAEEVVANTLGVRTVDNQLSVDAPEVVTPEPAAEPEPTPEPAAEPASEPAPAPVELKPGTATYYNSSSRVALYGTLPADAAASLEDAFSNSASKPVESFIVVSEDVEAPAWVANFGGSLDAMQDINKGKIKVQPSGDVHISGIATSEEAKQAAADKVNALFEGQTVSNRIVVRAPIVVAEPEPTPEPAPAPFMKPFATISDTGSDVKIMGLLPPSATDSIKQALEGTGRTVISNITVDERVMEPEWTSAISQSFNSLGSLENGSITVSSSGELIIGGTATTEADGQAAIAKSQAAFGNSVSLRNDIKAKGPDISQLFAQIDLAAIRFRTNSSELDSESVGVLDQVADALKQVPGATVAISGHTDSTGKSERNQFLSAERAEKVRTFLIDRGISGDRMTSQGYGSSQPIAANNTVTGRAQNRRIDFGLTNGE